MFQPQYAGGLSRLPAVAIVALIEIGAQWELVSQVAVGTGCSSIVRFKTGSRPVGHIAETL